MVLRFIVPSNASSLRKPSKYGRKEQRPKERRGAPNTLGATLALGVSRSIRRSFVATDRRLQAPTLSLPDIYRFFKNDRFTLINAHKEEPTALHFVKIVIFYQFYSTDIIQSANRSFTFHLTNRTLIIATSRKNETARLFVEIINCVPPISFRFIKTTVIQF